MQLVGDMSETEDAEEANNGTKEVSGEKEGEEREVDEVFRQGKWSLVFLDVPEVQGKRPAASRLTMTIPVLEGNPRKLIEGLGYG